MAEKPESRPFGQKKNFWFNETTEKSRSAEKN